MTSTFLITCPPSVNGLFANAKHGRMKTKYRDWIEQAGWELKTQRPDPVSGDYELAIVVPRTRGDLDSITAVSDLLVTHKLIDDDVHAQDRSMT